MKRIEAKKELIAAPAPESYVYILYSAGLLKIGTTIDPQARVDGLRSASASPVSLIWLIHGAWRMSVRCTSASPRTASRANGSIPRMNCGPSLRSVRRRGRVIKPRPSA